ncbi:kinase-like protein [Gigaspora margarita]|uniref:Kinase-like protein n=1 Tax=Gigaspora margarita TaxID=4874 RepID=A0A8H4B1H9_GIGMA|nr:kinase-like protein [Gigaspora margarita]
METIEESDIMPIVEEFNDMQVNEDDSNDDQKVNQNNVQADFQMSSTKRRLKAKEIKEIKELWKQYLEDMHYNSIFNGSELTNSFRNCLHIFVEEKLSYAEEKSSMVQELENVILEQNLVLHNYVDFAAIDKIDEGSVGIVYKSLWKNKLIVAVKCLKIDSKPEEKEFRQFVREPFQSFRSAGEIQMLIFEGKRETPLNGTPQQYVELYTICWDDSPEERPDIKKVLEILNKPFVNDSRYLLP